MTTATSLATTPVRLSMGRVTLEGNLVIPPGACRLVLVAPPEGGAKPSSRDRHLIQLLHGADLATLVLNMLTAGEQHAAGGDTVDEAEEVELLARRIVAAVDWAARDARTSAMTVGVLTSSTTAAAALVAAANRPARVGAIAARSGRPHLAGASLGAVFAPTLFIVGQNDGDTLRLNEDALSRMRCLRKMQVVEGASHSFREPGTLESAGLLARDWFQRYLGCTCAPSS